MLMRSLLIAGALAIGGVVVAQPAAAAVCGGNGDINICKSLDGVGPQFTHFSNPFSSDDKGSFLVEEYVLNNSNSAWTDYHITLQSLNPSTGLWEDSDDFDQIDFFGSTLTVAVNGVDQASGWSGQVIVTPIDRLEYLFTGFTVQPGDTLTLSFTVNIYDFATRDWRLAQHATVVPLPGAAVLFASALVGFAALRRRS
jgi:hypothetical protein